MLLIRLYLDGDTDIALLPVCTFEKLILFLTIISLAYRMNAGVSVLGNHDSKHGEIRDVECGAHNTEVLKNVLENVKQIARETAPPN